MEPQATVYLAFSAEVSKCLQEALEFRKANQGNMCHAQKAGYDSHRRPRTIQEGDLVLLDRHFLSYVAKTSQSLHPDVEAPSG